MSRDGQALVAKQRRKLQSLPPVGSNQPPAAPFFTNVNSAGDLLSESSSSKSNLSQDFICLLYFSHSYSESHFKLIIICHILPEVESLF